MSFSRSAKVGLRTVLTCGRRFAARSLSISGSQWAPAGADQSAAGGLRCDPKHLLSALCGFPKDLRYGPSAVRRKDGFGDDACFIARHSTADVVGVADGVGGWRTYGVDPSRFARSLMRVCAELVRSGDFSPQAPADLIADSYRLLNERQGRRTATSGGRRRGGGAGDELVGSSTACVVVLDRQSGLIHTANLGDSGFLVIRSGKVVHRSREQQHYFNAPFQLSLPVTSDSRFLCDSPESADTSSFSVLDGDMIVVATDGLFDNMPTHLIESALGAVHSHDLLGVQAACNSLALQARQLAMDVNHMSPFARKALEHGITDARGGKPDDITLILALVTSGTLERIKEDDETEVQQ